MPQARRQYYGARALKRLQELVDVVLHEGDAPLDSAGVIAMARGTAFIIADRSTPIPAEVFAGLPGLRVVMRSAIDIRNIDVAAASAAGVLVTHAEAGFVKSVVELTLGFLVDLSRGISRAAADYHADRMPEIKVGRQLSGAHGRHHRLWPDRARTCAVVGPHGHDGADRRSLCPGRRPAFPEAASRMNCWRAPTM